MYADEVCKSEAGGVFRALSEKARPTRIHGGANPTWPSNGLPLNVFGSRPAPLRTLACGRTIANAVLSSSLTDGKCWLDLFEMYAAGGQEKSS